MPRYYLEFVDKGDEDTLINKLLNNEDDSYEDDSSSSSNSFEEKMFNGLNYLDISSKKKLFDALGD